MISHQAIQGVKPRMPDGIRVTRATRDCLRAVARERESYDSVIRRLLGTSQLADVMDEQYAILRRRRGWKKLQQLH